MTKQRRERRERYTGLISIGDRVAFIMPGEGYVTAGTVENIIGERLDTLVVGRLSGTDQRFNTTLTVRRALVVENKSEVRRIEDKQRKEARRAQATTDGA